MTEISLFISLIFLVLVANNYAYASMTGDEAGGIKQPVSQTIIDKDSETIINLQKRINEEAGYLPLEISVPCCILGLETGNLVFFDRIKVGTIREVKQDENNPLLVILVAYIDNAVPITSATQATIQFQNAVSNLAFVYLEGGSIVDDNLMQLAVRNGTIARIKIDSLKIDKNLIKKHDAVTQNDRDKVSEPLKNVDEYDDSKAVELSRQELLQDVDSVIPNLNQSVVNDVLRRIASFEEQEVFDLPLDIVAPRSIQGVGRGGAVLFNGVRVGTILKVRPDKNNLDKMVISVSISATTHVTRFTKASLKDQPLTGIVFVELTDKSTDQENMLKSADDNGMIARIYVDDE